MIKSKNKLVACSPFPKQNMEKVIKSGIAMIDKKVQLQELSVLMPNDIGLDQGSIIWVRGDTIIQPWAKEVYLVQGIEFILVPESAIQLASPLGL